MFYKIFVSLCEERGVKPYSVVEALGIKSANSIVNGWKNSGSTPRRPTLEKIAAYFDVPVEYLLTGDERYRAGERKEQAAVSGDLPDLVSAILDVVRSLPEERQRILLAQAQALIPPSGSPDAPSES